ncbi:hypothetical protein [Desulfonatronum lacustre]|uniref:hypothetical protein n=1 Tax=Desulfonatronum lacustre TaxID=66849 RepID=UPI000689072C|nr:hypothetical protein [Desulfonatronum lacustre]
MSRPSLRFAAQSLLQAAFLLALLFSPLISHASIDNPSLFADENGIEAEPTPPSPAWYSFPATPDFTHRISLYAGKYTTQSMGDTATFWSVDFEENHLVALAYARDMLDLAYDLRLGPEVGVAARFGCRWSAEIWAGAALRHRGIVLFNRLRLEPAFTLGLSWIHNSIGIERNREETQDGDATWLVYLGPELAFSLPQYPQWTIFYRLHHRSGAFRTFGNLKGGHNANTIGLRYSF